MSNLFVLDSASMTSPNRETITCYNFPKDMVTAMILIPPSTSTSTAIYRNKIWFGTSGGILARAPMFLIMIDRDQTI